VVYSETFGAAAYIARVRLVPLRNTGAALAPLRMERICQNALAVAKYLQAHNKVEWVRYAALPEHPDHALAQKYLASRASGILSFSLKAKTGEARAAGERFLDALGLFVRLVNIGDAKSLATHPASTTHRLRLSIGIEHIDDLLADLEQALAKV